MTLEEYLDVLKRHLPVNDYHLDPRYDPSVIRVDSSCAGCGMSWPCPTLYLLSNEVADPVYVVTTDMDGVSILPRKTSTTG